MLGLLFPPPVRYLSALIRAIQRPFIAMRIESNAKLLTEAHKVSNGGVAAHRPCFLCFSHMSLLSVPSVHWYRCPSLPQAFTPALPSWPAGSLSVTSSPKEGLILLRGDNDVVAIFFFLTTPYLLEIHSEVFRDDRIRCLGFVSK